MSGHIDDSDICEKCNGRHGSCHCLLPVDCELGRDMCTSCTYVRCDLTHRTWEECYERQARERE